VLNILWLKKYYYFLNSWYLKSSLGSAAIDSWFELIQFRLTHRGSIDTIGYIKGCRLAYTRFLCGDPLLESPAIGVRLTAEGLPVVGVLTELMRRDDLSSKRLSHSLLLVSRLLPGTKDPDLSTVTAPSTSVNSELFRKEIEAVVKGQGWVRGIPVWESLHLSTKAGPNGQSMMGAMSDLHLLTAEMLDNIRILTDGKVNHLIEQLRLFNLDLFNNHFKMKPSGLLSKLSVVKDKEAKARIIAILDYWSQTSLRPLHLSLFGLLERVRGDCTFNQASFAQHLPDKGPYFSYDLSAATDRFPLDFQKIVIEAVTGSREYSTSWGELLANREFYVPWEDSRVKYTCGQPMGAYSSWAAFALSHHVVVRIAAMRAGLLPSFHSYALLGDDIVLTNSDVAREYRNILNLLGVSISETKSHVSIDTFEFAKRWIHRGEEMTGAPLSVLLESRKLKWFTAAQWIRDVEARWSAKYGLASRSLFVELFVLSGVNRGYSTRLAHKAFSFYHLPVKDEQFKVRFEKALYFAHNFFDDVIGCNRGKFALTLMWEWLAEAKTNVIEETIKEQAKKLNTFLAELSSLSGLLPEELDAQSALRLLVPVQVVLNNLGDLQRSFEKLRKDFTSGRERSIVMDSSNYQRAIDPTKVWSKRQSQLVLYNKASLINKFSKMASIYVYERGQLLALPHSEFPEGTSEASFESYTDKTM